MRAWILPLAITLILGISSLAYGSDYEDSLMLERLVKSGRAEKQTLFDSLLHANTDYAIRLGNTKEYIDSWEPEHYRRIWRDRFLDAEAQSKLLVIDSMFADYSVDYETMREFLLTEKYRYIFDSDSAFWAYRTKLALMMGERHTSRFRDILLEYYHTGKRRRTFQRPSQDGLKIDAEKIVAETSGPDGIKWGLIYRRDYPDSLYNLWLIRKEIDSDTWQGPWFTGFCRQNPVTESDSILNIFANLPYLKNSQDGIYQLVSPRYLTRDWDNDGFYNVEENAFGTDPAKADTDGDGIMDGLDINPLGPGLDKPTDIDLAVRAVLKLFTDSHERVNIYLLSVIGNNKVEYYTNSLNAMFLQDKIPWGTLQYNDQLGGIPILVSGYNKSDSVMLIFAQTGRKEMMYQVERIFKDWIITAAGPRSQFK